MNSLMVGYDHAFVKRNMLEGNLNRMVELEAYNGRNTVFEVLEMKGNPVKSRRQIDIEALFDSFERVN